MRIYRVQDKNGHGPFQPGFSKEWADEFFAPGKEALPTWMEEFGYDAITKLKYNKDLYFGSGVKSPEEINKWFSETERNKLRELGFDIVSISFCTILNESKNQVLFARAIPLNAAKHIIPWASLD